MSNEPGGLHVWPCGHTSGVQDSSVTACPVCAANGWGKAGEIARLLEENAALREIARTCHWMARRYADGRSTYAPTLFNDCVRTLLALGVELNPTADGTLFARDGMGRSFDRLSPDAVEEMKAAETVVHAQVADRDEQIATLRQQNADLTERAEKAEQERDAALAALRVIRGAYGQVCDRFEACEHPACRSSYSAWQVADAALKDESVAETGKLDRVLTEACDWADTVFHTSIQARAHHLLREAHELEANPTNGEEMADVLILAAHITRAADQITRGVMLKAHDEDIDLAAAVEAKLAVLRTRRWGQPDEQGVVEHVREEER